MNLHCYFFCFSEMILLSLMKTLVVRYFLCHQMKYAIVFVLLLVAVTPSSALSCIDDCEQKNDLCEDACSRDYLPCSVCTTRLNGCKTLCSRK